MALENTNLLIQAAHLPATFRGTPDELFVAMVQRMKIVSPGGTTAFVTGANEPPNNQGPWLKNGTQWRVWDSELKQYIPLDVSESETRWFQVGSTVPINNDPPVWLRTTTNPTEAEPTFGTPIAWYLFDGTTWIDFTSLKDRSVTQAKLDFNANFFATASGTNQYSVFFPTSVPFSYGDGSTRAFAGLIKFTNANTGPVSLSVNGEGGIEVKKNVNQAMVANEIAAGSVHLVVFDGVNFQIQTPVIPPTPPVPIVPGGIIAFSDGLVIQNNAGAATTTVDIAAQRVLLTTSNGVLLSAPNVSQSIDITVAGLGGLDTVLTPEAPSTWYYIWLVSNGTNISGVFSVSGALPELPDGYIYTALLGVIYNDAGSNLIRIYQTNRRTSLTPVNVAFVGFSMLHSVAITVPPIAKTAFGSVTGADATLSGDSNGVGQVASLDGTFFEVPLITPQSIYNGGTNPTLRISGFTI